MQIQTKMVVTKVSKIRGAQQIELGIPMEHSPNLTAAGGEAKVFVPDRADGFERLSSYYKPGDFVYVHLSPAPSPADEQRRLMDAR